MYVQYYQTFPSYQNITDNIQRLEYYGDQLQNIGFLSAAANAWNKGDATFYYLQYDRLPKLANLVRNEYAVNSYMSALRYLIRGYDGPARSYLQSYYDVLTKRLTQARENIEIHYKVKGARVIKSVVDEKERRDERMRRIDAQRYVGNYRAVFMN